MPITLTNEECMELLNELDAINEAMTPLRKAIGIIQAAAEREVEQGFRLRSDSPPAMVRGDVPEIVGADQAGDGGTQTLDIDDGKHGSS